MPDQFTESGIRSDAFSTPDVRGGRPTIPAVALEFTRDGELPAAADVALAATWALQRGHYSIAAGLAVLAEAFDGLEQLHNAEADAGVYPGQNRAS